MKILVRVLLAAVVMMTAACDKFDPITPTPATGTITFMIDTKSCGTEASSPIADVYVDDMVSTLYNQDRPSASFTVSAGPHTIEVKGSRGTQQGKHIVTVGGGSVISVPLKCTV